MLTGEDKKLLVHILDQVSRQFQVVIGCYLLAEVGDKITFTRGEWKIRQGNKRYQAYDEVSPKKGEELCGFIMRRCTELDPKEEVRKEFGDCFCREGQRLTTTGKVTHVIYLIGDRPVFAKSDDIPTA